MTETDKELLEATGQVLAEEGYAALTTEKVATRAGVSHPTVHYHFETKEGLLVAFVEEYTDQWLEQLDNIDGGDAGEQLTAILSLFVDAMINPVQADFARAMLELHTRAPHVDALQDTLARLDQQTTEYVAEVIDTGIEEGTFYDVDSEITAELILCAVDGATVRAHTLTGDPSKVLTEGLTRHVLADLYVGDAPNLSDSV